MYDFDSLTATRRVLPTAEIVIELGPLRAVLVCRPATEDNVAYHNAWARANSRSALRGIKITRQLVERLRLQDAELFARHCVMDWDAESLAMVTGGETPEFSVDECLSFFRALIEESTGAGRDAFDAFRADIRDPETFTELLDPADVEEQAGNSRRG